VTKNSHWLLPTLFTLGAVAFYFWYSPQPPYQSENNTLPEPEESYREEPITPIPLTVKLDARKVALGRRLFHDPILSDNNTISCATCHDLKEGGVDGLAYSTGIDGQKVNINAPTVFNSGFNFRQFWDGRAATLEDQMVFPIENPKELGSTLSEIVVRLKKDESYRREFADIYQQVIQPQHVKNAIATFERSLITPNSKFDQFLRGDNNALNKNELAGYQLFKKLGCISCHQGMNVGGNMYGHLGLANDYFEARGNIQEVDFGRYSITKNEKDRYVFRVPSLRNVALTAPYFHDASAATLKQAVTTMAKFQLGITLSGDDTNKIVMFLNTLTGVYQDETRQ